jgi:Ser/Thr protein kinase RdoA (MazF antagonist)
MKTDLPTQLYAAYGLDVVRVFPMQSGYRNHNYPAELAGGRLINLIVYKQESGMLATLANSHQVAEYLHVHGYPARHLYDQRVLRLRPGAHAQYAAVYGYLPGQTIPWEAYTREHIKALGAAMARMHRLLDGQPQGELPLATDTLGQLCERMRGYFATDGIQLAVQRKLGVYPVENNWPILAGVLGGLQSVPGQPLHLDFVRGNVLFAPGTAEITGVIDFEKVAFGHPLVDVARTLAFLLVDCKHKPAAKVRKYFLRSGYIKRGERSLPTLGFAVDGQPYVVLETLVDLFLLHDFYKFLLHNPYEFLHQNEHYVRTRDLLVLRGCLSQV